MPAGNSIGHGQFAVVIILNEGVEAAGVHLSLQNDLTVCQILGVNLQNTDMFSVDGGME